MRGNKLIFLTGIFILLIINVSAFSWNPFDWDLFNKDIRLNPQENYDLDSNGILNSNDHSLGVTCANQATLSGECLSLDENTDGTISLSEFLVFSSYFVENELITEENEVTRRPRKTYQCNDNQTIMKLSGLTNAHAGENFSDYNIEVCYNEIFGVEYSLSNPPKNTVNTIIVTNGWNTAQSTPIAVCL